MIGFGAFPLPWDLEIEIRWIVYSLGSINPDRVDPLLLGIFKSRSGGFLFTLPSST